jgi:Ca-activated chloride channel homolog
MIAAATRWVSIVLFAMTVSAATHAQPTPDVTRQANSLLRDGDAEAALALYGETETPLSPLVAYDKALAHLALGQVDQARPLLAAASHAPQDLTVAARARFNLGYLAFQEGSAAAESNPAAAIEAFERSAKAFQASYDLDPSDQQTSRNIELARLAIRELKERLEEQKKQQQQQQQQQNDLAEQLKDLAEEQEQLAEESKQAQSPDQSEQERAEKTERIDQKQDDLNKRTQEAKDKLEQMQQQPNEATQNASRQLEQAQEKQQRAGQSLEEKELEDAASEQQQAAELLRQAAETLQSENKQDQPQDDGSKGDPQQDQESEQDADKGEQQQPSKLEQMLQQLLDKERQEREDRQRGVVAKPGSIRPVEKDW